MYTTIATFKTFSDKPKVTLTLQVQSELRTVLLRALDSTGFLQSFETYNRDNLLVYRWDNPGFPEFINTADDIRQIKRMVYIVMGNFSTPDALLKAIQDYSELVAA